MSLPSVQHYFEELRHEVHAIFCLVADFEALFPMQGDPKDSVVLTNWNDDLPKHQILGKVARRFFGDLNAMMQESYVLKVARLADPASSNTPSGKRTNLTIYGMQELLRTLGRTAPDLERIAKRLTDFIETSAKPARNLIVAHSDWRTRLAKLTVGGATEEQTAQFHSLLQSYCDGVTRRLDLDPSQLVGASEGDAMDLMRALKWAYKIRVTCSDQECPFQKYDIRPVRVTN